VKKTLVIPMLFACALLVAAGCGSSDGSDEASGGAEPTIIVRKKPKLPVPQGTPPRQLVANELIVGKGKMLERGDNVTMEYVGVLWSGRKLVDSWEREKPYRFQYGIPQQPIDNSWETGMRGMRVGGRRELIVPPVARRAPPGTPPSQTLVYIIDLQAAN
jgi:FKBP-type peptidyl-prolyl cis-trans isomerase